jgi:hypothetical protein
VESGRLVVWERMEGKAERMSGAKVGIRASRAVELWWA